MLDRESGETMEQGFEESFCKVTPVIENIFRRREE